MGECEKRLQVSQNNQCVLLTCEGMGGYMHPEKGSAAVALPLPTEGSSGPCPPGYVDTYCD